MYGKRDLYELQTRNAEKCICIIEGKMFAIYYEILKVKELSADIHRKSKYGTRDLYVWQKRPI